jgi:hypothetical protein
MARAAGVPRNGCARGIRAAPSPQRLDQHKGRGDHDERYAGGHRAQRTNRRIGERFPTSTVVGSRAKSSS